MNKVWGTGHSESDFGHCLGNRVFHPGLCTHLIFKWVVRYWVLVRSSSTGPIWDRADTPAFGAPSPTL
eukprot:scaffold18311_cov50-Skeletonema_dohrnii-CCMP3373.AAC.1